MTSSRLVYAKNSSSDLTNLFNSEKKNLDCFHCILSVHVNNSRFCDKAFLAESDKCCQIWQNENNIREISFLFSNV